MIDRFYERLRSIVGPLDAASVLDAGCGEGETIARLSDVLPPRVFAVDILDESVAYTKQRIPSIEVSRESVYELPFEDDGVDLVISLEVLEHLERPSEALGELARVAGSDLVLSVPHEPYFRLGSLLRGKYLRGLGNHPEHLNHWNRRSLLAFLQPRLDVVDVRVAFPWLLAHCRPRQ